MKKCPVCGSTDVEVFEEEGVEFIRCKKCGYDESVEYDEAYPDQKSQRGGGGSPYKRGGALRTQKR